MATYFQCKLIQDGTGNTTVGWIEKRGARIGTYVELKGAEFDGVEMIGETGLWRVMEVHGPELPEYVLRQKQANDRNALPSIIGHG